jgi:hypothetical protein
VRTAADTATTYASQSFMALLLRYSTRAMLSVRHFPTLVPGA